MEALGQETAARSAVMVMPDGPGPVAVSAIALRPCTVVGTHRYRYWADGGWRHVEVFDLSDGSEIPTPATDGDFDGQW